MSKERGRTVNFNYIAAVLLSINVLALISPTLNVSGISLLQSPSPEGEQRTLVLLVGFRDSPFPATTGDFGDADHIREIVFTEMSNWLRTVSYGKAWIAGTLNPKPYTLNESSRIFTISWDKGGSTDLLSQLGPQVQQDYNLNDYDHFIVLYSPIDPYCCAPEGGIDLAVFGSGALIPVATKVILQLSNYGSIEGFTVLMHEYVHSMGLLHAYNIPKTGGRWDIMATFGWRIPAEFLAWSRIKLGYIDATAKVITWNNPGGTIAVRVGPLESQNSSIYAIKIPIHGRPNPGYNITGGHITGGPGYYMVEVRQHIDYDSYLPETGVLITYIDGAKDAPYYGWLSYNLPVTVIDSTPDTETLNDALFGNGHRSAMIDAPNNLAIYVMRAYGESFDIVTTTPSQLSNVASHPPTNIVTTVPVNTPNTITVSHTSSQTSQPTSSSMLHTSPVLSQGGVGSADLLVVALLVVVFVVGVLLFARQRTKHPSRAFSES